MLMASGGRHSGSRSLKNVCVLIANSLCGSDQAPKESIRIIYFLLLNNSASKYHSFTPFHLFAV